MVGRLESRFDARDERELRAQTLRRIKDDGITKVRLAVVDMHGIPRAKMVTAESFAHVMQSGHPWQLPLLAVDIWQNVPPDTGYGEEVSYGNGTMRPDLRTFARLPWAPDTAHVIADVFMPDGTPTITPRQVLARVLDRAHHSGFEPVFGSELEFYIYTIENGVYTPPFGMQAWFTDQALGESRQLVDDFFRYLTELGIPLYEIFNEHGGGQFEANLRPGSGVGIIDQMILMKVAIKEIAHRHGYRATFMSRPSNDEEIPPSGYHLHQCLLDRDGANAFVGTGGGASRDDALSTVARHFIGGQLRHAMGLTGIAAPTVTAYKRLSPGTWAPVRAAWGFDNRTAMIRAIGHGEAARVENRLGGSCANPYLLAAALLAAGLDGVEHEIDPGQPTAHNVLEDERYPHVPTSLIDGIRAFADDGVLVEWLGHDFARAYVSMMKLVWKRFQSFVTDWEIKEYRELL